MDFFNFIPVHIELLDHGSIFSRATGFVVEKSNNKYLITNWHVVTGKDPITGKLLSTNGERPSKMRIWIAATEKIVKWVSHEIKLYNEGLEFDPQEKLWIEHPKGKEVDVVAVPLKKIDVQHALNMELAKVDMLASPAMNIFIIGYPLGLTGGGKLPVWIGGTIASEPTIDVEGPFFYVNASGRGGLSGAPAMLISDNYYATSKKFHIEPGRYMKFMGIYSGRAGYEKVDGEKISSDICRVWKPSVLDEMPL